jgi:hypothetical protein
MMPPPPERFRPPAENLLPTSSARFCRYDELAELVRLLEALSFALPIVP